MKNKICYMQTKTYVQFLIHINLKDLEYDMEGRVYYKGLRIKLEENIPILQIVMVDKKDMTLNKFSLFKFIEYHDKEYI